jgi:hypothetical protein
MTTAAAAEDKATATQELTALAWAPAGCPPTLLTATAQVLFAVHRHVVAESRCDLGLQQHC